MQSKTVIEPMPEPRVVKHECAQAPTELNPQIGEPARQADGSKQGKDLTAAECELRQQCLMSDTLPSQLALPALGMEPSDREPLMEINNLINIDFGEDLKDATTRSVSS